MSSKINIVSILVILVMFAAAALSYSYLPAKIASHWGFSGNVNGYMGKVSIFLIPVITVILLILFIYLPKLDPLKKNYKYFQKYYNGFILAFVLYMAILFAFTLAVNLGIALDINIFLSVALAILFFFIGILLGKTRRNWFIGIRTPWTISSDYVWNKTHKLGGRLFMISGILSLLGIFIKGYGLLISVAFILISAVVCVVYSYLLYIKVKK